MMQRLLPTVDPLAALAVLVSGGLDSAVLLGEAQAQHPSVHPLYIRCGLAWERVELDYLRRYLARLQAPSSRPLQILEMPVADLYASHWSLTGEGVPGAETPDEAVFLPGRNVLLLAKALLWCHLNGVSHLLLAPLESNPFPDATPTFFRSFQDVVNQSVGAAVQVSTPYLGLTKADVIRRGRAMPLAQTFSCIRPQQGSHCGVCNKCAERRLAFQAAGVPDPTTYASETVCTA